MDVIGIDPAVDRSPRAPEGRKFRDPRVTADGSTRASVAFRRLETLWINTGTMCNLACDHCYIESSPRNDSLAYIGAAEVAAYLDEIDAFGDAPVEIGFTGGEPFMNPEFTAMLDLALSRGHRALVLTNAMRPMMRRAVDLIEIRRRHGDRLAVRVSVDHFTREVHEEERGPRSWQPTVDGLVWLDRNGFAPAVAGRTFTGENEADLRAGYAALFAELGVAVDAADPHALVLFPEMDGAADVPEITTACWGLLGISPDAMMCASSRMVVKRRGAAHPVVVACTLLSHDPGFELGRTLAESFRAVPLNHPHCARFCVLGGGSCSP